jgi:adenosylhomocysteine nucleosidase
LNFLAPKVILLFSADYEWQFWLEQHQNCKLTDTPFGNCFDHMVDHIPVLSMRGGWGKVSAAASTQWAIDQHQPDLIVNLGTCGGLEGRIDRHTIVLVERTWQYDIHEQMTDPEEANQFYSCTLDLDWLGDRELPEGVIRETMFSADRDILPMDVANLIKRHAARVADWESGAIAWVAERNHIPLLILRGVSDLVSPAGGESYGNVALFQKNTRKIIEILAVQLPWWLHAFGESRRITFQA